MFGDRRYLPPTLRPDQLFDELLAAGLAVATIDYRLSLEAKFPAQLYDAKAAVRYLRTHADQLGLDPGRIGVWGESAGGHLAAMVGLTGERSDLEARRRPRPQVVGENWPVLARCWPKSGEAGLASRGHGCVM